jgi:branched-chain amino acid transport system permease protein
MLLQSLASGIPAGSVYALLALGFVLLYKGTRVIHFGYGEQVVLSAYLVIIGQTFFGLGFGQAVAASLLLSALFGAAVERLLMRPLGASPILVQIIATLALGAALREGLRAFMGPNPWPFPFLLSPDPIRIGDIVVVAANLAIVAVALLVMALLYLLFRFTRYGQAILSVYENRVGAAIVGVSVSNVLLSIWVMVSVLAAIAGVLVAPLLTLSPDMGLIAIKGFTAAVLGGFSSLPGAVVAGILLGIIETLAGVYLTTAFKDSVSYALLIAVIVVWPHGLFGGRSGRKV